MNEALFVNDMITDQKIDILCLTETWLKPDDYITLNESIPKDYCYKHEPRHKGRGGGVAELYNNTFGITFGITQKSNLKCNSFEVMVLHTTAPKGNDKTLGKFTLATVYRPPGHHADFIKKFGDFLSELVLVADRVIVAGDFNIHVDNDTDVLGLAFNDILNSIGVKENVTGPTHLRNHTLDYPQNKKKQRWVE